MYKQSPVKPSAIPRFYALFMTLLFTSLFLFGYNYFDIWLMEKKYAISSVAAKMRLQIREYRYHANHIFELSKTNSQPISSQETPSLLKINTDVYWLEHHNQSVDTIIFGQSNDLRIQFAQRLSDYLEILWGPRNEYLSMYYLNGRDNNLLLVTTHSVLKPEIKLKESYLTLTPETKRTEMLEQSITLEEKESISHINVLRGENIYFYTYKAAFNAAGELTTIIAFDLPINNLLPVDMSPANFRLNPINIAEFELGFDFDFDSPKSMEISLNGFWLEFSEPLDIMPYKLIYQVPLKTLIVDLLFRNVWLLLSILIFFLFSLSGLFYIRRRYIAPNASMNHELSIKDALNGDIISNIPIGLLVYDFESNQIMMNNKIAERLIPHLDLNKVRMMAQQHHGVIQTSIDEVIYEVKMYNNRLLPETYLFLLQDKDKEVMITKRLQLAHREYDKSIQARRSMLSNINNEIKSPIKGMKDIAIQLNQLSQDENEQMLLGKLLRKYEYITEWVENISLLNKLELGDWQPVNETFSLSSLLEHIFKAALATLNAKGLKFYYYFNISHESLFIGDSIALNKIITLLLNYSITTTSYGKVSLTVNSSGKYDNHIQIELMDSGSGLSGKDLTSLNYPFLNEPVEDKHSTNSGMTFYLCNQLCKKMGGSLEIKSKLGLGTHYVISLPLLQHDDENGETPQLLEGITALIDINSPEVNKIIHSYLNNYGATYFDKSKENITEEYDIILTDRQYDEEKPTILLVGDLSGFKQVKPGLVQCNYNFVDAVINAISFLIEESFSLDESRKIPELSQPVCSSVDNADLLEEVDLFDNIDSNIGNVLKNYQIQLANSDYGKLFVETVPMDITKLYTDIKRHDLISLSQTVHRLKGAFAMLDLKFLRSSCEALEKHIADNNEVEIKNSIRLIDSFVTKLLQQGNQ
ncbi:phosphotransferase RcsD [Xenorhabdus nematophila]|uniref:Phosphotransferase RcsD n=1 Tax=Xenorhabdus nematophila (strain ATCC 19061 / DSM 3370 / CCUG 14189 / LMG 1036 / NCIMB 9965 / AN6) TaxID=406817 RepID=D3VJ49_XENNA|nr:phosphotransferase RcsD [Xenorhabdus nematophila]CEE90313.1 putative sensory histidine kinase (phosphotransfer intermediate) associated with the RcsBC two-component regulatory system [Xenorhabdus nematophila str. Anatoliense]CEF32044.1 putative sensory histidine kinase (phosphotransfer intermediate) associated with the RcsBC two-component regulatory system [Xenorhabdus nematophila str. Websteri]AYA39839.1 phosphotransferase RcsD [Xenorhabdus nematophila]KHD29034.1 DNA mismatch repair protein